MIQTTTHPSGIEIVSEKIPNVRSASLNWWLPVGIATDPTNRDGLSTLICEWIFRGAGELNSIELSNALDRLGIQRAATLGLHHLRLNFTGLGSSFT